MWWNKLGGAVRQSAKKISSSAGISGGSESIGSGEDTLIFDYGAAVKEACMEEAEITILVVNLSLWKRELP